MANSYIEYTANGSTTTFSIPFAYTRQADVTVFVGGTSTSFTFASSSTISLSTAPTSGTIVRIKRTTVITTRAVDFTNGAILTEADLDNSNIQVFQAAQEAIDTAEASISKAADGKFDAQSRVIKNVANPVNAQDAATKNWSETASTSQVNIATTKASEASSSATASANSATAASSSASGASNSATAAANSATAGAASASTAATKAALATTNGAAQVALATTQAGLATTNGAAQVALATTQAGLATTNGAAQVVLATAQKTIAVTKASESAASATASANSATASANSATASGNSATAAASSASTATTKRNESSASATAAANSAAAAATALDSFDDRYLGAKSSAPGQDNDGNALVQGALYFDTSANGMKVYDGSAWIAASSSGTASLLTYKYIATNNQTTFTGSDANSVTLTYTATNILVLLNGITLDASDYTATNGSSIVLGAGATTGSELVVVAFKSFTVADHYTKSQANALLAAKATTANFTSTGIDDNATSTAITIDASENLIVGGTAVGGVSSGTKTYITSTGNLYVASSGEEAAYFNRNSNDGSIVEFRKNNATVGSIGTASSKIYIGSGDAGLYFNKDGNAITPVNTTTVADNDAALDLGTTTARFKDAYLSGGVYLGGTGSANKLDDYESGSWTPSFNGDAGGFSGTYTKVGDFVRCTINKWGSVSSNKTNLKVTGLPFPSAAHTTVTLQRTRHSGATTSHWGVINSGGTYLGVMAESSTMWACYDATNASYTLVSGGAVIVAWEFTYRTSS